jgi:hypothetical protein
VIPDNVLAIALLISGSVFWALALTGVSNAWTNRAGIGSLAVWTLTSIILAVRALL